MHRVISFFPLFTSQVTLKEDGSGAGGYAKEMSPEWFAAA